MRIAVWHNLPSGGAKRALYDHVAGLVKRGHYVESWSPPTADLTYLPLSNLIREHVVPLELEDQKRNPWGPLTGPWAMKRRLKAMDYHCSQCGAEIASGSFDILFANTCSSFATSPIARHTALPSVLYLQEPFRDLYEALPALPWAALAVPKEDYKGFKHWKAFLGNLLRVQSLRIQMREEIANAAEFDVILVNSLFSRESVLRAYGLESKVCYLGIDLERFQPTGEAREQFVVGLGALSHHKGPDRAIEALGAVDPAIRPRFVWVGNSSDDQEYESRLHGLAKERGVDFEVRVRISDGELRSVLSRAAMLLYTSRLEPFGFAPLEANACGTLAVAIAEGGVRETIQDENNGFLVNGADPQDVAQVVQRLINDPIFSYELGRRALSHVRKYWPMSDAIDRVEIALSELTANHSPKPNET